MPRKGSKRQFALLSAALAGVSLLARQSRADLTWDSTGLNPTQPSGGSGVWNSVSPSWSNGASDVPWDSSGAIFGGINALGGIVTINTGTGVLATGLTFNATSDGSTFTLVGNAPGDVITLGAGSVVVNQNAIINTSLAGSNGLSLGGTSVLQLGAVATYTGTTSVSAGTLQAGTNSIFAAASAHVIASGATLDLNNFNQTIGSLAGAGNVTLGSATLTTGGNNLSTIFSGAIGGTGGKLTKIGSGTLVLTTANSYSGLTTVSSGVVTVQNNASLGTTGGPTLIASGAAVQIDGNGLTILEPLNTLTGTGVSGGGALRNLANNNTWQGAITLGAGGARINSDYGTLAINGGVTGTQNLTLGGAGNITVQSNEIGTETGSVTYDGSGTLTLIVSSHFSGGLVINGGTVVTSAVASNTVGAANQTGIVPATLNPTAITISNGATFRSTKSGHAGSSFVTTTQGITVGPGGAVLDLTDTSDPLTFLIFNTNDVIAQGTNALTKTGPAVLALAGTTTGSGPLNIAGGMIRIRSSSERISDASPVTISAGAFLDLANFVETVGSLAGPGNVLSTSGILMAGADNSSTTFSGILTSTNAISTGGFGKVGTGTMTLKSPVQNNYSGTTTISGGTLRLGAPQQIPDVSNVTVAAGATLDLNGFNQTIGSLAGAGSVNFGTSSAVLTAGGKPATTAFSGILSGSGSLVKPGSGTFSLTGATANTYTGGTTVNAGTLTSAVAGGFGTGDILVNPTGISGTAADAATLNTTGSIASTANVTVNSNSATAIGTLNFNGAAPAINSLAGNGNVVLNNPTGTALTTGGTNATSLFSGVLSEGTPAMGSLIKQGTGTFTLSGINTYTGGTTINGGILSISADANLGSASALTTINNATLLATATFSTARPIALGHANSTLDVSGASTLTYSGTFTGTGGLTKGAGTGTLNLTNPAALVRPSLTANGGNLNIGPATGLTNPLTLSGALTINNNATVTLNPTALAATQSGVQNNAVGSLSINTTGAPATGGLLDIGNHFVYLPSTPANFAAAQTYWKNGYNLNSVNSQAPGIVGAWDGRGGIGSSVAKSSYSPTGDLKRTLGVYDGAFGAANGVGMGPGADENTGASPNLAPNQILIRPTLAGDMNGDGKVDDYDILIFNTFGFYNNGTTNLGTQVGDLNGDGVVNDNDILIFNTAGNYLNGNYPSAHGASPSASPSAKTATASKSALASAQATTPKLSASATASSSSSSQGASPATATLNPPSGTLAFSYDPATGDLKVVYNGFTGFAGKPAMGTSGSNGLSTVELISTGGAFVFDTNALTNSAANGFLPLGSPRTSTDFKMTQTAGVLPDGTDFGRALAAGLDPVALSNALTLKFNYSGSNQIAGGQAGLIVLSGVPEPTSLSLLGLAAMGLLGRRRKSRVGEGK